jgi:hypothetical protein
MPHELTGVGSLGRGGENPATNRLSYCAAELSSYLATEEQWDYIHSRSYKSLWSTFENADSAEQLVALLSSWWYWCNTLNGSGVAGIVAD